VVRFRLRSFLWARWRVVGVLAVVVAITGAVALTLAAGAARTLTASDRYEAEQDVAFDVVVEQDRGRPRTAAIAALPAVRQVRAATFVFGGLVREGGDAPTDALVFAGSISALSTRVVAGREPDPGVPGEFAASQSFIDASRSQIGDTYQLVTISQEQAAQAGFAVEEPDGPTLTATLVGAFTGPSELQDGYPVALFPPTLLDQGDIGIAASQSAIDLEPGSTRSDLRAQLDSTGGGPYGIAPAEVVPGPVRDAVAARGQGIAVVAGIIALATVVVVGQLLGRRLRLADVDADTMRAMGMTPRQLLVDPVARALVPVAVGSVGAAALAIAVSGRFPLGFVEAVEPRPGTRFDPAVHLGGAVVLGLALTVWVALASLPGRNRDLHSQRGPSSVVDAVAVRTRPVQAAMGLRFAFTRPARASGSPVGPFLGLVLVLAASIAAFTFGASLARQIDDPARYGSSDLLVGQGGDRINPKIEAGLEASADVRALSAAGTVLASVGPTKVSVTGLQPVRGDMRPQVLSGRLPAGPDEIALGRGTARELGQDVGDTVVLTGEGTTVPLRLTGLVVVPSVEGGDGIGSGGIVTPAALRRIDPGATLSTLLVDLPDRPRPGAMARLRAAVGSQLGEGDPPAVIINLDRIRALPYVVATALGLLGALSLGHLLLTSARLRRRDVAVLGSLGADRRWMSQVVHWQSTVAATLVLLAAIPVGLGLGRLVFRAFIDRVGSDPGIAFPARPLLLVAAGTLLLANLVAILPAHHLRRLSVARHLNNE